MGLPEIILEIQLPPISHIGWQKHWMIKKLVATKAACCSIFPDAAEKLEKLTVTMIQAFGFKG